MSTVARIGSAPGSALRIGRNVVFRLGAQVLSALANVAAMVVLGRALAPAGYGDYAFYYALVPLLASVSDLGVGVIVTRELARDPVAGTRWLGVGLRVKGVLALALLAPALAVALSRGADPAGWALVAVTAAAVLDFSQDPSVWVARARERQELEAALLLVSQLVWLAGIVACVRVHAGLPVLLATAAAAFALRWIAGAALILPRLRGPQRAHAPGAWRALVREGVPVALAMAGVAAYGRIGVLALRTLGTRSDVAYFNVAYMLSQPLGFVSTAITLAVFPLIAREARAGGAGASPALTRLVKAQLLVAFPVAAGLFALADRILPMLFHSGDYARAGAVLRIMSLGLPLVFLNLMARYTLAALDRQAVYLRGVMAGLAVNALVSLVTIPRLGTLGAALAFLATETTVLLVCRRAMHDAMTWRVLASQTARPLAAALVMGALVAWAHGAPLALVVAGGAAVFAALALGTGALDAKERAMVWRVAGSFAGVQGRLRAAGEGS